MAAREEQARAQRQMSEAFFDPTMAGEIVKRLGPGNLSAYNPRLKHFVWTPYDVNLQGMYVEPGPGENPKFELPVYVDDRNQSHYRPVTTQEDQIYNFGMKPDARVLAHEYRHRAGVKDEYPNRLADAMYSQTPEDWEESVRMFKDLRIQQGTADDTMTYDEAEQSLLENIASWRESILEQEWKRAPVGQKPYPLNDEPDIGGFIRQGLTGGLNSLSYYVNRTHPPFETVSKESQQRRQLAETAKLFMR